MIERYAIINIIAWMHLLSSNTPVFFLQTPHPLFGLDCTAARPPRPPAMSSRIGLRLQLMRDQMQQEEQRERERQQQQAAAMHYMQQRMPGPPAPSPAISAPSHFQAPMQVPVEVLKVGIKITRPFP